MDFIVGGGLGGAPLEMRWAGDEARACRGVRWAPRGGSAAGRKLANARAAKDAVVCRWFRDAMRDRGCREKRFARETGRRARGGVTEVRGWNTTTQSARSRVVLETSLVQGVWRVDVQAAGCRLQPLTGAGELINSLSALLCSALHPVFLAADNTSLCVSCSCCSCCLGWSPAVPLVPSSVLPQGSDPRLESAASSYHERRPSFPLQKLQKQSHLIRQIPRTCHWSIASCQL